MNSRAFTLSLIIAGVAMFMVYSYMEGRESYYVERYQKEGPVVVASRDIKELEMLDDSKVTIAKMPQTFLAPGHIKDIKEVFNTVSTVAILKGEQITRPRITYPGARTGLSRQISSGKRAMSINVDNAQAVSRLIKPGDRVDVMVLIDYAGGRKDLLKVQTVLQDVLVLSTGLSMTNSSIPMVAVKGGTSDEVTKLNLNIHTDYSTVTLELSPYEVQKLTYLVSSSGRIYLSLRNNDDKQVVRIKGSRLFDLLGDDADEARAYFANQNLQKK
ncbi:MAG: Flp pilus assembly protein CpaB [Oligoflexia bacterium]|nr:Flp pilus assembly protein CpaB [Oligoflexia bacterium]